MPQGRAPTRLLKSIKAWRWSKGKTLDSVCSWGFSLDWKSIDKDGLSTSSFRQSSFMALAQWVLGMLMTKNRHTSLLSFVQKLIIMRVKLSLLILKGLASDGATSDSLSKPEQLSKLSNSMVMGTMFRWKILFKKQTLSFNLEKLFHRTYHSVFRFLETFKPEQRLFV